MSAPMYCTNHPNRETLLRCAKCDRPICTECAIRHPVGLRCPECAKLRKVPTYDVPTTYYLRAFGAGLITSAVSSIVIQILPLFFLSFFAALVAGGAIAEVISRVTRHKRGMGLQIVAGLCIILGFLLGSFPIMLFRFGGIALPLLAAFFLNPYYWIYPIIAIAVAVTRLR
jgi:hypothetical protein